MFILSNIESLFGRLLVLVLYCSVALSSIKLSSQFKMQTAKKNAEHFVSEAYESGLNDGLYFSFMNSQASLGFNVEFSLVGKDRAMDDQEILTYIKTQPLTIEKDEFLTCRLSSKNIVLRIGGRS